MIVVKGLSKGFASGEGALEVIRDLSFSVAEGAFFGVIGSSGCGKTTLLRMICGFEKPSEGSIFVNGREVSRPSRQALMVFQSFEQLLPWKTVLGNLTYPLLATKTAASRKEAKETAERFLEEVGLGDFAKRYPYQLSGGMKQRLAVARALCLTPKVLLMDEPFAALDSVTRSKMQDLTLRLWQKYGLTIVFVTHSIAEVTRLADRILLFGPTAKIIDNDASAKEIIAQTLGFI